MPTYTATDGNDAFVGTALDDTFNLFGGSDAASGLAGNDTFVVTPGGASNPTISVNVSGGDGDDDLEVTYSPGAGGGVYSSDVTFDGGAGTNTVFLSQATYPASTLSFTNVQVLALAGDSTISTETVRSVQQLAPWVGTALAIQSGATLTFTLSDAGVVDLSTDGAAHTIVYASLAGDAITAGANTTDLYGGPGNDTFIGGPGVDVFHASLGQNIYEGGSGSTTVDYSAATSGVTISLASTGFQQTGYGDDKFSGVNTLVGSAFASSHLTAGDQSATLEANGTYGAVNPYNSPTSPGGYSFANAGNILDGGAGDDILIANGSPGAGLINSQNDMLFTGNANGDVLNGGAGDDTITVGFSGTANTNFKIYYVEYAGPNVVIRGGDGDDAISTATHATIDGGAGDDVITIMGLENIDNSFSGAAGEKSIVTGGAGSDTFIISNAGHAVYIMDFTPGEDHLNLSQNYAYNGSDPDHITITQQGPDTILTGGFSPIILLDTKAPSLSMSDFIDPGSSANPNTGYVDFNIVAADTVTMTGTAGDDILAALPNGSSIDGGAGDDVLIGGAGSDHLYGGLGDDVLKAGLGTDYLDGGLGLNTVDFTAIQAAVTVDLTKESATLAGGAVDTLLNIQTVIGSGFNDTLIADNAGETLVGGSGADSLTGGLGADTFKYLAASDSTAAAPDYISDFQTGLDKIDVSSLGVTDITFSSSGGVTIVDLATGQGEVVIDVQGVVALGDIVTGVTLTGGAGYDNLVGGAGNDVITGGGGADSLTGGAGADTFKYVAASDSTAQGYDIIQDFQHGVDAIDLTAVAPTYISLVHSGGATYLFPATPGGNMEIAAIGDVEGTDLITGAPVNLYLVADDNGDTLIGGAGADSLHGGAGNDVIIGGGEADALFGGAGPTPSGISRPRTPRPRPTTSSRTSPPASTSSTFPP